MSRYDPFDVEVEEVVHETEKSYLVKVDGSESWVAKSQISNLDEYEEYMSKPTNRRGTPPPLTVPKWLAIENFWTEEED